MQGEIDEFEAGGASTSFGGSSSRWEIEELEEPPKPSPAAVASASSSAVNGPTGGGFGGGDRFADLGEEDGVFVAVGKLGGSSMAALSWALKHLVEPSGMVYLLHVFPTVRQIPTPLGPRPKHELSSDEVDAYMTQERQKRRKMLQKYIDLCNSHSHRVKVDIFLIESDHVANGIVELIPVLSIKELVVGTSKSNPSKLNSTNAGLLQQKAPIYCEVRIINGDRELKYSQIPRSMPANSLGHKFRIHNNIVSSNRFGNSKNGEQRKKNKIFLPFLSCFLTHR